jgi:hypothetical protein
MARKPRTIRVDLLDFVTRPHGCSGLAGVKRTLELVMLDIDTAAKEDHDAEVARKAGDLSRAEEMSTQARSRRLEARAQIEGIVERLDALGV